MPLHSVQVLSPQRYKDSREENWDGQIGQPELESKPTKKLWCWVRTKYRAKKPTNRPQTEEQEEKGTDHASKTEQDPSFKTGAKKGTYHTGGEETFRTNIGSNNEETGRYGIKANVLRTPGSSTAPPKSGSTTSEPSCPAAGIPDPDAMGKPPALDPNGVPVNGSNGTNQKKENERNARTNNKQETRRQLNIGTWNVRRGLVRRENEINDILKTHEVDIFFLTETDTKNAKSFNLPGYTTMTQLCECESVIVRIIALVKNNIGATIVERTDLMSKTFPSIWLEIQDKHKSRTLVGGFYRQWSSDGKLTVPEQVSEMEEFCRQINSANSCSEKIIILGDANLCAEKWLEIDYIRKSVAQPLIQCLDQNGL